MVSRLLHTICPLITSKGINQLASKSTPHSFMQVPRRAHFIGVSSFEINTYFLLYTSATTSDLQSELSGLGVSVYDQNEFEEGVLDQINKEFSKRAVEQQKKFLLKEHSNVKKEIACVG